MKQKRKQLPEKQQPADGKLLQWHPAFYADLQIEFREETEKLKFFWLALNSLVLTTSIVSCF